MYPLELYLLAGDVTGLPAGLYHYEPPFHSLRLLASGDLRARLGERSGEPWTARAPAMFVLAGIASKLKEFQSRAVPFMWAEAGCAAQGLFVQAVALGLGSTFVGGINADAVGDVLSLDKAEEVLAILPVGRPQ